MPLVEALAVGHGCTQWNVWGTTARILVTDTHRLEQAEVLVRAELAAVDEACSRFRPDSELERLPLRSGRPTRISGRLAELVATALAAASETDGDVDPTLGTALAALGYDRDFAEIAEVTAIGARLLVVPPADWRGIRLEGDLLSVPAGTRLDLGATAKAWAADRCAEIVAQRCETGVLVALGGDIASAGCAPDGWDVLVQDGAGEPATTVNLPSGAAIATSSTISRSWQHGNRTLHHILDPRTGYPATPVWRTASVVAETCVRANTLSTAAIVRGRPAGTWLQRLGAPARLVARDGSITTCGGWPTEGATT